MLSILKTIVKKKYKAKATVTTVENKEKKETAIQNIIP